MNTLDLNVATPDEVPQVLRNAVDAFRESATELRGAWQDKGAGRVWLEIANVLERAAIQAQNKVEKYS